MTQTDNTRTNQSNTQPADASYALGEHYIPTPHNDDKKALAIKWFHASRPKTLGLAFAVIIAGACQVGFSALRLDILLLSLLSAGGFQLLSNFANDYGDFQKGTDAHRPERERALSGGNFSVTHIQRAIIIVALVSLLCTIILVWRAPVSSAGKLGMFGLGVLSVIAAIAYTVGRHAYGYYALGDIMVFVFFGLVGVVGSYYLQGGESASPAVWCLAITMGLLSASVLHINNLRDREKDHQNHKKTIANLLKAPYVDYYYRLILSALVLSQLSYALLLSWIWLILPAISTIFCMVIYQRVKRANNHGAYCICLAKTVQFTAILGVLSGFAGLISAG